MSNYYKGKRSRNIYQPNQESPFKLSRSRLDLFLNCARCFYIDRRLGVDRPPGFPFNINSAVDNRLKNEFDYYRKRKQPHPWMVKNNIKAIPFDHHAMDTWRDSLRKGIQYHHQDTNLLITGGIDDVWINDSKELIIVDYKATSKKEEVTINADWQIGYKRQMEIYQWLFRKNSYQVNDVGYFVYCNADGESPRFNGELFFDVKLIPYKGNDSWVDEAIRKAYNCLNSEKLPEANPDCDYCLYRKDAHEAELISLKL